ncbi:MAG: DNA primase [Planctomycetota bacterium]
MSAPLDFDVKERVRAASDIVDVIGRDLEVRRQGRHFVARCPFHNDTRPSMSVNQERQTWKCWVCDIGGDVFNFVMRREGVDFPTALRSLADAAGIELPEMRRSKKTQAGQPDDRPTLREALALLARAYQDHLASSKDADAAIVRNYADRRGMNASVRDRFGIGFAPQRWDFAIKTLRDAGYTTEVAVAAGVAIERASGGAYDRFRGRLMFPIIAATGEVISMGGRIIPEIVQQTAAADGNEPGAKYINGPETLLFRKSRELYGLNLARDAIRHGGEALIMEGYTDVIAAHLAGLENAVAVLGTALTADHVRVLKRYTRRAVLVLDGDDAGRRRADEVLNLFVKADLDLRVLTLPEGADPADFLAQNSAGAMKSLTSEAPDAIDHRLARLSQGLDVKSDTHAVSEAIDSVLRVLAESPAARDPDDLKMAHMLERIGRRFEVDSDRLRRRLKSIVDQRKSSGSSRRTHSDAISQAPTKRAQTPSTWDDEAAALLGLDAAVNERNASFGHANHAPTGDRSDSKPSALTGIDRELFEVLIESPAIAATAVEAIDPQWLDSDMGRMLFSAYQDLELAGRELDVDSLLTLIENDALKMQIVRLQDRIDAREAPGLSDPETRYSAIVLRYREREFAAEESRQIERLKEAALPEDEEVALLEQLIAAQRLRHTPT